jgi:hypothetical protein
MNVLQCKMEDQAYIKQLKIQEATIVKKLLEKQQ